MSAAPGGNPAHTKATTKATTAAHTDASPDATPDASPDASPARTDGQQAASAQASASMRTLGSRNDHTRRHNLSALLTAVHYGGDLTRAQLTRDTGLNRSTIGGLVTELADLGLVIEDSAAETGAVGRPSLIVRPVLDVAVLAVHPDVDALEVGVVAIDGTVRARSRVLLDAAPSPAEAVALAVTQADALVATLPGLRIAGVAAAVPGLVGADAATVVDAPHLGWRGDNFGGRLAQAFDLPASVGNDANLGLRAEWGFGAARGHDHVVYLNGSASGIGGAALIDGAMLRGARGYGGEFGHMMAQTDGVACSCGRRGCLETVINADRVDAAAHDAQAIDALAGTLAAAIANLECAFDPDLVLLGGYLGRLYDERQTLIDGEVERLNFRPKEDGASIARAALGGNRLLVGAAERALGPLLADPAGTTLHHR